MIEVINADCREVLKDIPDQTFDAVITDPPYGINYKNKYEKHRYDVSYDVFFEIIDDLYRVMKKDSWLIFWWSIKKIPDIAKITKFEYVWTLPVLFSSTYSKSVIGDRKWTPVFAFKKGNPKVKYRRTDVLYAEELPMIKTKIKSGDFKPTLAIAQILQIFTEEDDYILDPFYGYGSLGLVAKLFKRRVLGIEIDKKRYEIALDILNNGFTKSIPDYYKDDIPGLTEFIP